MRISDWRPAGGWGVWGAVLAGLLIIGISAAVTLASARHGKTPVTPAAVTSTAPNPGKHAGTKPPHPRSSPARTFRSPVYVPSPVSPAVTPARSPSPATTRTTTPAPTATATATASSAPPGTTAPVSTPATASPTVFTPVSETSTG